MNFHSLCRFLLTGLLCASSALHAEEVLVAVASNFHGTMQTLAREFEQQSGYRVQVSPGSTGQHYAQIINGAPYQLFLAADKKRPERLEQQGMGVADSRKTYALGRLTLWAANPLASMESLMELDRVAIANPRLAPYGEAALQVLQAFPEDSRPMVILGENVTQAFQFAATGSVSAGLVSLAQVLALPVERRGFYMQVPVDLYDPIEQQMLLLQDTTASRAFYRFLQSQRARQHILESGYGLPMIEDGAG